MEKGWCVVVSTQRNCNESLRSYSENRATFPVDELAKYGGQWVAWSADGSRIVAHHEQFLTVLDMVKETGIDPADVVFSSIPPADEVQLL